MPTTTTRLGLIQPIGADSPSEFRIAETTNTSTLDNAAIFKRGTLAARPGAGTLAAGTYYLAMDDTTGGIQGTLYQSNGSTWGFPNQIAYQSGTTGTRPAASTNGRIHLATDTRQLSIDNGASWCSYGFVENILSSNGNLAGGDMGILLPGVTATLPAVSSGLMIGAWANGGVSGASPAIVTTSGGNQLQGRGHFGATSIKLGTPGAFVILYSDGASWIEVAGEQDTGWVTLSLAANWGQTTGYFTPAVRLRADTVTMRGAPKNNTGGNSTAPLAALSTTFRPTSAVFAGVGVPGGTPAAALTIQTDGTSSLSQATISGASFSLDGFSYALS